MNKNLAIGRPNFVNKDFYVYGLTVSSIAAAAQTTSIIQIEADASFYCTKLTYFASIAGAAVTDSTRVIPLITMQVNDQGSGRNLLNQAMPLGCIGGEGDAPFIMPLERLFRANSSIALTFNNFSAATTYRLDVAMIGFKVWG